VILALDCGGLLVVEEEKTRAILSKEGIESVELVSVQNKVLNSLCIETKKISDATEDILVSLIKASGLRLPTLLGSLLHFLHGIV